MKKLTFIAVLSGFSLFANFALADAPTVVPNIDVAPEYPASALRRDKSGYVSVRFDVAENGKAYNVSVVEAFPDSSFNSATMTAVRRSNFEVISEGTDSEAKGATNVVRTYRFSNDEELVSAQELSMN